MSKRSSLSPKVLLMLVVAVLAIGGGAVWFWLKSSQPVLNLPGEIQAKEIRNGSRFGGRVLHIRVREGDVVKTGQILVEFDDTDLEAKITDARATLNQAILNERKLARGADINAIRQANAAVSQAQAQAQMVNRGARPEELSQAKSHLTVAETQYKQASNTLTNAQSLLESGIISQQKYDSLAQTSQTAKAGLDSARAAMAMAKSGGRSEEKRIARSRVLAAQAQANEIAKGAGPDDIGIAASNVDKARSALQSLEAQMGEVRIKAPFSGVVSVIGVTEGELVSPGRSVVAIIDYDHLWTDVYVPESRLLKLSLSPGDDVDVLVHSDKSRVFPGKISLINPKSEFVPNGGGESGNDESSFRVKVQVGNTASNGKRLLYPGMKVDVRFR